MKKFKITKGNRVYIVDAKSHIDAINKVKAVKTDEVRDSISQWNPGMSEIGLFQISYKRNGVYQSILVRANSEEQAKQKLLNNLNGVDIIGVNSHPSPHFHEPILDSSIKDDGYYYLLRDAIDLLTKPGAARGWSQPYLEEVQEYMVQKGINPVNVNQWKKKYESLTKDSVIKDEWSGIRSNGVIFNYSNGKYTITHKNGKVETFPGNKFNTAEELFKYIDNIKDSKIKDSGINYGTLFIDLNSSNELTASRIVQELENEIGNNKIAEIRGGSFTPVSEHSDGRLDLDFKEFKNNEWGTNHITLMVRSSLPFLMKTMKDDPKYGAYKLRAELNSKLKQFANKTIYSNKSFTMDSKIKDIDEYKKNYAAAMRAAGEKTKKDQINSDIQKLYDIAKQYGPVRTEQNKLNNEFEHQNMQVVRNRFYNDPTVKRALKQMEDIDTKWNVIVDKYNVLRQYRIPQDGPNRFMSWDTPTKKWVDDIKKQLIKDSAIKDEDYSKYLSIVKQLEKLVEPANRALQQKIAKYGVTKQDIRNNSPKYRDVCREIPELKVWAKLIMQLPGELAGFMPAHPSQESVDKLKKAVTNSKAFDSTSAIKDMPLMFKSNVNMQSLKSNIDNVKNKPNETYINSLNANIQGIIADIEEIKGYEKEGKFNESPALKFSCKNLTAQYYKLLNDPKLQGTLHKLDVPTYKNVLYAEHQAQMLSQVTLK